VFALETAEEIELPGDDLAFSVTERLPTAAALMHKAKQVLLAFRRFRKGNWRKI
jgi:hypothetical protein